MSKALIYALDDEINILHLIKYNLEEENYKVKVFQTSEALFGELKMGIPDLILLDIMMPNKNGYEVVKLLKNEKKYASIPVIFISAKGEEIDRVFGIEVGADDYMVKPFSIRELSVRVKAMLRREERIKKSDSEIITAADIVMDLSKREVTQSERVIDLTFKEFELLKELVINKGVVMSRNTLVENVWGIDFEGDERTVDVHVRCLQQKLSDDSNEPQYIETIRGVGYRFLDKKR